MIQHQKPALLVVNHAQLVLVKYFSVEIPLQEIEIVFCFFEAKMILNVISILNGFLIF